jgi:hypothetical protein
MANSSCATHPQPQLVSIAVSTERESVIRRLVNAMVFNITTTMSADARMKILSPFHATLCSLNRDFYARIRLIARIMTPKIASTHTL